MNTTTPPRYEAALHESDLLEAQRALELGMMTDPAERKQLIGAMVADLRDAVDTYPHSNDTVHKAYMFAKSVGGSMVSREDNTAGVSKRLQAMQNFGPNAVRFSEDDKSRYMAGERRVLEVGHADPSGWRQQQLEAAGIRLRQPGDAKVIDLVVRTGHEYAHALLDGLSNQHAAWGVSAQQPHRLAISLYMQNKPELAYTGNLAYDTDAHEERFAEGYGRMVAAEAMASMGYSKREISVALHAIRIGFRLGGEAGDNQIDHLRRGAGALALQDMVGEQAVDQHKVGGYIGYDKPLSPKQIKQMLNEITDLVGSNEVLAGIDEIHWGEMVGLTGAEREIRQHVRSLREQRQAYLR